MVQLGPETKFVGLTSLTLRTEKFAPLTCRRRHAWEFPTLSIVAVGSVAAFSSSFRVAVTSTYDWHTVRVVLEFGAPSLAIEKINNTTTTTATTMRRLYYTP